MDYVYKEVFLRGQLPPPWKIKSLPKFNCIPGRKFNDCPNAKRSDGEPPTPPPSPVGTFKYPALLRGSNVWLRDSIVTEICNSTNHDARADPGEKKRLKKARNFLVNVKPASGKTRMYLWPKTKSKDSSKLDLTSLTRTDSTSKVEGVVKFWDNNVNSIPKKLTEFLETGDTKKDTTANDTRILKPLSHNRFGAILSIQDFDVILKHAFSHDPVIARHNSTPRIQRSMIFAERPKNC